MKYTINTELKLEPILISISLETYKKYLEQIKDSLLDKNDEVLKIVNKYLWLVEFQLNGILPNTTTLRNEFPSLIFEDVVPVNEEDLSDYVTMYITQKKNRYISRKLSEVADTVRTQGMDAKSIESLYSYTSLLETSESYVSIRDTYTDIYTSKKTLEGMSFLCPALDTLTGGMETGQVCTVLGASGSMKTTYTCNIAYDALKCGKNVLFLSLEESPMQLYSKFLSRTSVDLGKPLEKDLIIQNKLEPKDQKILLEQIKPAFDGFGGHLYIVGEQDIGNYSLLNMENKFQEVDKLAIQETGKGIDVLVVDHIQLLKFADKSMSEQSTINMYVSFFRQQSLAWLHTKKEILVILLSQANREGIKYAQQHSGAYQMQHVAEASEIERSSAYIISVFAGAENQQMQTLILGVIKLRGSQLPESTIPIYANAAFYHVGEKIADSGISYSASDAFGFDNKKEEISNVTIASVAEAIGIDL